MDSENTIFENENRNEKEATQLDLINVNKNVEASKETEVTNFGLESNVNAEENDKAGSDKKKSIFKKVAAGLGLGVLMGASAIHASAEDADSLDSVLNSLDDSDENNEVTEETLNDSDETDNGLNLSDGEVSVASSVSDDMSFSEAFAAAREEVGPGGVFEWNGNVYNTYYVEEWENMSDEERSEFASHVNVEEILDEEEPLNELLGEGDDEIEVTEEDIEVAAEDDVEVAAEEDIEVAAEDDVEVAAEDDVEVAAEDDVEVAAEDDVEVAAEDDVEVAAEDDVEVAAEEYDNQADVEVLGVYHDSEFDANVGVVSVDDQQVILLDNDNDGDYDYIAADIDQDGVISEYEMQDMSDENITVDMLEMLDAAEDNIDDDDFDNGFEDESLAFNDFDDDYINDANVDDFMA